MKDPNLVKLTENCWINLSAITYVVDNNVDNNNVLSVHFSDHRGLEIENEPRLKLLEILNQRSQEGE